MKIQRPRLLIIEDSKTLRTILTNMLRYDYLVFTAAEGCEGYSRAVSSPPDIILLDFEMPGWNGLQTLLTLRDHPKLKKVPVLVLTCIAEQEIALSMLAAGANGYLLKETLVKDELVGRIEQLLVPPTLVKTS